MLEWDFSGNSQISVFKFLSEGKNKCWDAFLLLRFFAFQNSDLNPVPHMFQHQRNFFSPFEFELLRELPTLYALSQCAYSLTAEVVGVPQVGPTDPQMISQPVSSIFPCSPLPSGTWQTPGLSIPWCCLPTSFSLPCLLPPFTVLCKMVLARPDERETCPYHFSLRQFTMVRRASCGPIACWILAWTSSLVTWSLYEMRSVLR